jgi:hypothetical protein
MSVRTIVFCLAAVFAFPVAAQAPEDKTTKPAAKPKPVAEVTSDAMIGRTAKTPPCVIKPVMSDDDLRNCGARVPVSYEKPR